MKKFFQYVFGSKQKKVIITKERLQLIERNRIAGKTIIQGVITAEGDFRVDGKIIGDLTTSGKVIVGELGLIEGNVKCSNIDVEGKVSGYLYVSGAATLKSKSIVEGEVFMGSLQVEPGAVFTANCKMIVGDSHPVA